MKLWERFSDDELKQFVQDSRSINELMLKLGYSPQSGSGSLAVKQMIELKQLDISHFLGHNWNKNNYNYSRFQPNTEIKGANMFNALVNLRGHKCENCHLDKWQGQNIPLQIHHKDGDHYNNTLENLQLLCPNCHAQTENYAGRNKNRVNISDEEFVKTLQESDSIYDAVKKLKISSGKYAYERANKLIQEYNIIFQNTEKINYCKKCNTIISKNAEYCIKCAHENQRKVDRPTRDILKEKIFTNNFESIGREYNVSSTTIRKWCDYYSLPRKKKDIQAYSKEEWEKI